MKTHLSGANQSTLCGTRYTAVTVQRDATCRTCLRIAGEDYAAAVAKQGKRDEKFGFDPIAAVAEKG